MRQNFEDGENLERIADALERLVIAADSIATALSLQILSNPHVSKTSPKLSPHPYRWNGNPQDPICETCGQSPENPLHVQTFTPDRRPTDGQ